MIKEFEISPLQDASVLSLVDLRDTILVDPEYQREGGVWSPAKRQLFIDSLMNRYDIPKLYFHRLVGRHVVPGLTYAIIDGRQRLEALWAFIDNQYPLSEDFIYMEDPSIKLAGKYFKEFSDINSRLLTRLYGRILPISVVTTDDLDLIEDMFNRLNDGVPLNAAEKRNTFGGPLPKLTKEIAKHIFFTDRIRVSSTRYRHLDIAGKLLWLSYWMNEEEDVGDTKKATIDAFFIHNKQTPASAFSDVFEMTEDVLDRMAEVFGHRDILLKSSGVIPVYFMLFMGLAGDPTEVTRDGLWAFEEARAANRDKVERGEDGVDFKLLEYDELARSSNDAAAINSRVATMGDFLGLT